MTTIKGQKFLTISPTANEIYEIDYVNKGIVDIINNTDSNVTVARSAVYSSADGVSECIIIPPYAFVNCATPEQHTLYITAASGNGTISLLRVS